MAIMNNALHGLGKKVLISGGSIAGPATAFWLNRYGFQTTIVERWPHLRPGGQSVDVNLYGLEAIQRMGLEDALRSRFTGEKGTTIASKDNKIYSQTLTGRGPTNETEILRGDFADMLYQETKDETEWVFGDYVTDIAELPRDSDASQVAMEEKVKVCFKSGKVQEYDFVILADGARSWSRKLVFGEDGFEYKPIGLYTAYFSIPLDTNIPFQDQWHIVPLAGKRAFYFRPDFKANTSRAGIMFMSATSLGYERLSADEQKAKIAEIFSDGGHHADRMVAGLEKSEDLYFEYLGQVHAPAWSTESGRVHLVGDAAWCGTPLIGMGTSLSVAGAYILAGEMAKHVNDPKAAAKGFEENMRPIVTEAQKLPPGIPGILFRETEWGVDYFWKTLGILVSAVTSDVGQAVFTALGKVWEKISPSVESQSLPDYDAYVKNPKRKGTSESKL